jgi:hypothetical protein
MPNEDVWLQNALGNRMIGHQERRPKSAETIETKYRPFGHAPETFGWNKGDNRSQIRKKP